METCKQVPLYPVWPVFTAEALRGGTSKALLRCPPYVSFLSIKDAEAAAALLNAAPDLLEALKAWDAFWEAMPKGQLGKIVCDVGLLNDAFMKHRAAITKATSQPR